MSAPSPSIEMDETTKVKPYQTMRGHTNRVLGVAHLPDGRRIITCSDDGSLRLWERESGAQIGNDWRDEGDDAGVRTIALSPNGKTVASGSSDGMVKLWDIETRKVTAEWAGHTDMALSVCWSADGGRVVSGSKDGTARVWDVRSGETVLGPINTGLQNKDGVALSFSPDASNFATSGHGIKIWDARTGELLSTLNQDSWAWSLVWTSDQKKLLTGNENGSITIFNTVTWQQIAVLEEDHKLEYCAVTTLLLFQNDRLLASARSAYGTACLWNLDTNLPVGPPLQHQRYVHGISLSADGKSLVTACDDNNAYVWDVYTILQETGLKDLLSVPNVTTGKSILDSDATRRPTKPKGNLTVVPQGFFDSLTPSTNLPPSIIHTDPPPATPPTNLPPSPARSDAPPSTRVGRHALAPFTVASARALLGRVFPRFRRSQPTTVEPMRLQEYSRSGDVSVHGPADVQVPAAQDNLFSAMHRPGTLEHPPDREITGQHLDIGSIQLGSSRRFGNNTAIKSTDITGSHVNDITNVSNWTRPSSDTGKHKRRLDRSAPKVIDVPLGQATYGDYVANREDVVRPYSLFCCLSWCQKKDKKQHSPPQQYDTDLMNPTPDDPLPTTGGVTTQQEGFELSAIATQRQPQPEAEPSCLPGDAER